MRKKWRQPNVCEKKEEATEQCEKKEEATECVWDVGKKGETTEHV